ncbi:MAG TPA: hypothetical protein VFI61_02130 [Patescibacteria group bacterium]|nr:hypothetical protein [Patescibacteria group bacterium]
MLNEIDSKVNRVPDGSGDLSERVNAAIEFAKKCGDIAILNLEGTPVVVSPGSDPREVILNWTTIRVLQERTKGV